MSESREVLSVKPRLATPDEFEVAGEFAAGYEQQTPEESVGIIVEAYKFDQQIDSETATTNLKARLGFLARQIVDSVTDDERYAPEQVSERILTAFNKRYHYSKREDHTLNDLVNGSKLSLFNLDHFRDADIEPLDEIRFLQASIIASTNRNTEFRQKIAKRAANLLSHEATNRMHLPLEGSPQAISQFLTRFSRGVFALQALRELQLPLQPSTESIDEALGVLPWTGPEVTPELDVPVIEETVSEDEPDVRFRPMAPTERDGRINGLQRVLDSLTEEYDDSIHINLFEIMVFSDPDDTLRPEQQDETDQPTSDPESDNESDESGSSGFGADYKIAEIVHTREDGSRIVHAIAESPIYGNACYVLRGEVLEEWNQLTGVELTWRDVFRLYKQPARQIGARNFRHYENSDVPAKVLSYIKEDPLYIVSHVFNRIFEDYFDENLQPTRKNRLPLELVKALQTSPVVGNLYKIIMEKSYRTAAQTLGRLAGGDLDTEENSPLEEALAREEQLRSELAEARQQIIEMETRVAELQKKAEVADEMKNLFAKLQDD